MVGGLGPAGEEGLRLGESRHGPLEAATLPFPRELPRGPGGGIGNRQPDDAVSLEPAALDVPQGSEYGLHVGLGPQPVPIPEVPRRRIRARAQGDERRDGAEDGPSPAPRPPRRLLPPRLRPRLDRVAPDEAAEVLRQGLGRAVAVGRVLPQALEDDRLEVPRDPRIRACLGGRRGRAR